jgi:cold shock CspA family protein
VNRLNVTPSTVLRVQDVGEIAEGVAGGLRATDSAERASEITDWLAREAGVQRPSAPAVSETRLTGAIRRLGGLDFGFIVTSEREELYFHRRALRDLGDWVTLRVGDRVSYTPGANRKGPCALVLVCERGDAKNLSGTVIEPPPLH